MNLNDMLGNVYACEALDLLQRTPSQSIDACICDPMYMVAVNKNKYCTYDWGVEPGTGIGDVLVRIERSGDRVRMLIENQAHSVEGKDDVSVRAGNHMALDNIRERLMLFFDAEAKLETRVESGRYRVEIDIPYRSRA